MRETTDQLRAEIKRMEAEIVHLKRRAKRAPPERRAALGGVIANLRRSCAAGRKRLRVRESLSRKPEPV